MHHETLVYLYRKGGKLNIGIFILGERLVYARPTYALCRGGKV